MDPADVALYVVALPLAAAAVATFALRRSDRSAAVAFAAAFAAASAGLLGVPDGWPQEASHWFLPVAMASGVAAWFGDRTTRGGVWADRAASVLTAALVLIAATPKNPPLAALLVPLTALFVVRVLWAVTLRGTPPTTALGTVALVTAAASATLMAAGWAGASFVCGAAAAVTAGRSVLARWLPATTDGLANAVTFPLVLAGLLAIRLVEAPMMPLSMIAIAPVALLIPAPADRPGRSIAIRLGVVAAVCAVAVGIAFSGADDSGY